MADGPSLDAAIAKVARRQHGNISRPQLHALGLGECAISFRVKHGRLYRVFRGVYAVGRPATTPLERAAAAVLACGPGAALSHFSALALWGFAQHWPQKPEVTIVGDRRPPAIAVHRTLTQVRRDVRTQLGICATSPARTLLECAPRLTEKLRARLRTTAIAMPRCSRRVWPRCA